MEVKNAKEDEIREEFPSKTSGDVDRGTWTPRRAVRRWSDGDADETTWRRYARWPAGTRRSGVAARRIRTRIQVEEEERAPASCLPSSAQHRAWESATPFETPPSDGEGKTADGSRGRGGVRGASRTADEANRERGCRFGSTGTKGGGRRGPNMGRFGSGALRSQLATRQQSCDGRGSEATEDGQAATDPDRPDVPPRAPPRHQTTRASSSSRTRRATGEQRERLVRQGGPRRGDRGGHDPVRDAA